MEDTHPELIYFDMENGDGKPSSWNTLRALPILRWYDADQSSPPPGTGQSGSALVLRADAQRPNHQSFGLVSTNRSAWFR